MRWLPAGAALALLLVAAASVRAEPPTVDRGGARVVPPRPLELAAGGHFMFAPRSVCQRQADMMGCTTPAFTGAQLAPGWRLSPHWSLGAVAAFDWSGESDRAKHSMWQAFAQGRWRPWGEGSVEPWLGAFSGVMAATDTLVQAPTTGDRSVTQYAPAEGLALGTDFDLGQLLAVGLEARGLFTAFGDAPALGDGTAQAYGDNVWLWFGVSLTFRPDMSGPQLVAARAVPR